MRFVPSPGPGLPATYVPDPTPIPERQAPAEHGFDPDLLQAGAGKARP